MYAEKRIWQTDKAARPLQSFKKFSIIAAWCGIAGRERWRIWEWLGLMPWNRENCKERRLMPRALGRSPLTKISLPSGKTPIPRSLF